MPKRFKLELSEGEQVKLERWTKNPPKPYLRERARAILRVAEGEAVSRVAHSLRIRVDRTTVSEWVKRYLSEGLEGLKVKPGRGRKAAFFPSGPSRSGQSD